VREHLVNLALKLQGCPYIWGGANPWTGFDCSGFVIWIYQVFGLLPSGDWTADGLRRHFYRDGMKGEPKLEPGDLVFYGLHPTHVTHVMVALAGGLVVGASGGDAKCSTVEEARRRGAQVKVKGMDYRGDRQWWVHVPMPGD